MMFSDRGGAEPLYDEDVLLADVLLDLDLQVLVREARGGDRAERNAETLADLLAPGRGATTPRTP
jgi:hypothetical protein